MVLRESAVFERLEAGIAIECLLVKVNEIIDRVQQLISQNIDKVSQKKNKVGNICANTLIKIKNLKETIKVLQSEKWSITGGNSQRGQGIMLTATLINEDALNRIKKRMNDEKVILVKKDEI